MNMSKVRLLPVIALFGAVVGFLAPEVQAQRSSGPKAGDVATEDIFQGEVTHISGPAIPAELEFGKTYVLEFWATWCAPCRKAIPHLNALYKDYKRKGITVIGVSAEEPSVVSAFVKKRGTGMSYTVVSNPKGDFSKAWKAIASKVGIPFTVVIGPTKRIAWFGSPFDPGFDRVVKLCSTGKYDLIKWGLAEPLLEGAEKSIASRDWAHAHRQLDKVLILDEWVFSDQMLRKYKMMLIDQEQPEQADAYLVEQISNYSNKPDVLADIAKMIVADPDLPERNLEIANQALAALAVVKGDQDPDVLEVVALVAYRQGDIDGAVKNQFQAWMLAEPDMKPEYKYVLDQYKAEQNAGKGVSTRRGGRR